MGTPRLVWGSMRQAVGPLCHLTLMMGSVRSAGKASVTRMGMCLGHPVPHRSEQSSIGLIWWIQGSQCTTIGSIECPRMSCVK